MPCRICNTAVRTALLAFFLAGAGLSAEESVEGAELPRVAEDEGAITFSPEEQEVLDAARLVGRAFEIVAEKVRPAVVNIQAERPGATMSQGSGVIVDSRGFIVTNSHVVQNAGTIVVRLTDGREFTAELVGESKESDIAVIRIQAPSQTVARFGDSDDCKVGMFVLAIGNPFGLESTVTSGIISAKGRSRVVRLEIADFLQTDAPINPGNSGGPLVNLQGEVIGITAATNRHSEGLSFAIPSNLARIIMNGIIAHKRVTSSYLGVVFRPVSAQIAEAFGLPSSHGALITKVIADTPAARAGFQVGDVIVKYGRREVQDDNQLRTFVATSSPEQEVAVEFFRKGERMTTTVMVEALPEEIVIARRTQKILEDFGLLQLMAGETEVLKKLGYDGEARGVVVVALRKDSSAAEFLVPGSLIVRVNDKDVSTPEEMVQAIGGAEGCFTLFWRFGQYYGSRRIICK